MTRIASVIDRSAYSKMLVATCTRIERELVIRRRVADADGPEKLRNTKYIASAIHVPAVRLMSVLLMIDQIVRIDRQREDFFFRQERAEREHAGRDGAIAHEREGGERREQRAQQRRAAAQPDDRHVDAVEVERPHRGAGQRRPRGETGGPASAKIERPHASPKQEVGQRVGNRVVAEQRLGDAERQLDHRPVEHLRAGERREQRRPAADAAVVDPAEIILDEPTSDGRAVSEQPCRRQHSRRHREATRHWIQNSRSSQNFPDTGYWLLATDLNEDKSTRYHRLRRRADLLGTAVAGVLLLGLLLPAARIALRELAAAVASGRPAASKRA